MMRKLCALSEEQPPEQNTHSTIPGMGKLPLRLGRHGQSENAWDGQGDSAAPASGEGDGRTCLSSSKPISHQPDREHAFILMVCAMSCTDAR